jgi:hypothetical protein
MGWQTINARRDFYQSERDDGWPEFGLSRLSASRGPDKLERAGLVSIARRPSLSPVVLILDVTAATD